MRPVVLIIMDGIGRGSRDDTDAVFCAKTPNLDRLMAQCPHTWLAAHGTAVGLPSDDDMGNSEVGHNALGCGQIYAQGAKLVGECIASGTLFASDTWNDLIANAKSGHALHFLGLLSDGNVHSNIAHLLAMVQAARKAGVRRCYVHILLDGRDVPATSALTYVEQLETCLAGLRGDGFDYAIASGGGRMQLTMDRYEADWAMVERGWQTHVLARGRSFSSAREAIETYRRETGCIDQDLPGFVVARDGAPVAAIENGDSVILFNFRGDRALEISRAFDDPGFDKFDRCGVTDVRFAGMLEYDGDLHIPRRYLVAPPAIRDTLTEVLCRHGIRQYALSETQKFGHVTYFWNGNRSARFSEVLETWEEIPSDTVPFDQAPRMKAAEIAARMLEVMEGRDYDFLRCNFPNGDMVGHTGNWDAVIQSVEALDDAVGQLAGAARRLGYVLLVTADHGNADQMYDVKKGKRSVRTAHSLNPVPFLIQDPDCRYGCKDGPLGLSNVAAAVAELFGIPAPASWQPSLLKPL